MLQQLHNTYFTPDEIENNPNRKDGISAEVEKRLRLYACELINNAGILLKLYCVVFCRFCRDL
jgi:hypothetical protein